MDFSPGPLHPLPGGHVKGPKGRAHMRRRSQFMRLCPSRLPPRTDELQDKGGSSRAERSGDAEAAAAAAVLGHVPEAYCGAVVLRNVGPGTAAENAGGAIAARPRIAVTGVVGIADVPAVLRP